MGQGEMLSEPAWAARQNTTGGGGGLKLQHKFIFSQFWGLQVRGQGASLFGTWWGLLSWLAEGSLFVASSHGLSS